MVVRLKISRSSDGRRGGNRYKYLKLILKREFGASLDNHSFEGVIIAQFIIQSIFLYVGVGTNNGLITMYLTLPFFWIPVLGIVFGATSFSRERESRMMELLKASPISSRELILGKISFCIAMYFVFSFFYLIALVPFALSNGPIILTSFAIVTLGPFFILYLVYILPVFLVSMASRRIVHPVVFGFGLLGIVFCTSMLYALNVSKEMDIIARAQQDSLEIMVGKYPDPMVWGSLLAFILLTSICIVIYSKFFWKGGRT